MDSLFDHSDAVSLLRQLNTHLSCILEASIGGCCEGQTDRTHSVVRISTRLSIACLVASPTHDVSSFLAWSDDQFVTKESIEQVSNERNKSEEECPAESEATDVEPFIEVVCSLAYLRQ